MFKQDSFQAVTRSRRCDHCQPLRNDTNVLVVQRLSDLSFFSSINLFLAILCVVYLASAIVCLVFNSYDNDCYPCETAAVSEQAFHRLEFGSTFAFSLVTTMALVYSPERRFSNVLLLKFLVLVNVCASSVAMLLVFYSLEHFEHVAHEIEYANGLCMSAMDLLIVSTLRTLDDETTSDTRARLRFLACAVCCIPMVMLVVFNIHAPWAEQRAHYIEFSFDAASAAVSFWFCIDSMQLSDRMKMEIMLAPDETAVVVDGLSRHGVQMDFAHSMEGDVSAVLQPYTPPNPSTLSAI
mmetsp:Transcript_8114/g.21206  ORF Transcript_8114/g.21206 Transcript_8114/m.21206 type:complete len:295 (-) Transcript_8114:140-1024(-)